MKIVIAGAGEVGSHLAKMLNNETNEITVIDADHTRLDALAATTDVVTVEGSPSSIEVLNEAGVAEADLFIAVNPSDSQDVNIVSAMLAKQMYEEEHPEVKIEVVDSWSASVGDRRAACPILLHGSCAADGRVQQCRFDPLFFVVRHCLSFPDVDRRSIPVNGRRNQGEHVCCGTGQYPCSHPWRECCCAVQT